MRATIRQFVGTALVMRHRGDLAISLESNETSEAGPAAGVTFTCHEVEGGWVVDLLATAPDDRFGCLRITGIAASDAEMLRRAAEVSVGVVTTPSAPHELPAILWDRTARSQPLIAAGLLPAKHLEQAAGQGGPDVPA